VSTILQGLQWRREDTPIHRLDPRSKLAWFLSAVVLTIFAWEPALLLMLLASVVPVALVGRVAGRWLSAMKSMTIVVVFATLLNILYFGLVGGLLTGLKFVIMVSFFSVFFMTTHPDDLGTALTKIGVPYTFTFILITSARYVPVLAWEAQEIVDAYKARGIELEKSRWRTLRRYATMLIPLVICTVRRSMRLGEAMEARAFGSAKHRTSLKDLRMGVGDYALVTATMVLFALGVITQLTLYGLIHL